jgi:prepilin-type N-terminal cleavage/methylation domain-containing protein
MRHRDYGFTLIEVLCISAILAFLASLLLHTIQKVDDAADHAAYVKIVKRALESWKKGQRPRTLRESSPAISVLDRDWEARYRLVKYQIGDCTAENECIRCSVRLSLRDPQGRLSTKGVTYRVRTSPGLAVAREEVP